MAATNQKLADKEAGGSFRRDLLYRLSSHRVDIPPLRERKEDIPVLLDFFLGEAAASMEKKKPTIPAELPLLLSTYHYPGNVRELRALIYDAVSVHGGGVLSLQRFKQTIGEQNLPAEEMTKGRSLDKKVHFGETLPTLKEVSWLLIEEAMQRSQGNQSIAARLLGVTPQALSKRLKKD